MAGGAKAGDGAAADGASDATQATEATAATGLAADNLEPTTAARPASSPSRSHAAAGSAPGSSAASPPELPGAQRIAGRYTIVRMLGSGAMGSVYCARDEELGELVALKMLRLDGAADAPLLELFRREVRLARRVTHPNVARTFDIGEHEGQKFLTMEFVDGEKLSAVMARGGLTAARMVEILFKLCAGLQAAHQAGVVHRDLKPDNVMTTPDGRVVITDFGIACARGEVEREKLLVGTPAYMAPEQVAGGEVDARADLYALGVIVFKMLTGRAPWKGRTPMDVARARLHAPPPDPRSIRPDVPPSLADVARKLMATRPEDRFARAEEVAAHLATLPPSALDAVATLGASPEPTAARSLPPEEASGAGGARSVAVLPFRHLGPAEDAYLTEGITEDVMDTLASTRGLRVCARGAVLRVARGDADPRELGRELGVSVVVEGSVRRAGDRYRITARLLSVDDGFQLWADRVECAAGELLATADRLARVVAETLTAQVAMPTRAVEGGAEGIALYLRARHEVRTGWHSHLALRRALECVEGALTRLPNDPLVVAISAVVRARCALVVQTGRPEMFDLARRAAERAVALAPNVADVWFADAAVRRAESDLEAAIRSARRALALSPGHAGANELLGRMLVEVGPAHVGIGHLEAALRADPGNVEPRFDLARAYALAGDWRRADAHLAAPVDDPGMHSYRGLLLARLELWRGPGDPPSPMRDEDVGTMHGLPRAVTLVFREVARTRSFRPEQFAEVAAALPSVSGRLQTVVWQYHAEMWGACGGAGREGALDAVARAVDLGLEDLAWMDHCPSLAVARESERFQAARARVAERAERAMRGFYAPGSDARNDPTV